MKNNNKKLKWPITLFAIYNYFIEEKGQAQVTLFNVFSSYLHQVYWFQMFLGKICQLHEIPSHGVE